jgi:hypothetical protein
MNAIDRAGVDAGGIFGSNTGFSYYIGHGVRLSQVHIHITAGGEKQTGVAKAAKPIGAEVELDRAAPVQLEGGCGMSAY